MTDASAADGDLDALVCVTDPEAAAAMLPPLRQQLLVALREPQTTAELGERLGLSRQKVGYHLRDLVRHSLAREAPVGPEVPGDDKHRDKRFRAAARHFLIDPRALGELAPGTDLCSIDPADPRRLLASGARMQAEVAASLTAAARRGERRPSALTIALDAEFQTPAARTGFAQSVLESVRNATDAHAVRVDAGDSSTRAYRILVCCYPFQRPST